MKLKNWIKEHYLAQYEEKVEELKLGFEAKRKLTAKRVETARIKTKSLSSTS